MFVRGSSKSETRSTIDSLKICANTKWRRKWACMPYNVQSRFMHLYDILYVPFVFTLKIYLHLFQLPELLQYSIHNISSIRKSIKTFLFKICQHERPWKCFLSPKRKEIRYDKKRLIRLDIFLNISDGFHLLLTILANALFI